MIYNLSILLKKCNFKSIILKMTYKFSLLVLFYSLIINFQACNFIDTRQVSQNEIKKASQWSKTDQVPSYNECEKFKTLEDQKKCFQEKLVDLIYSGLTNKELESKEEVNSELIIQIKINENGNFSLDSIVDPYNIIGKIPKLKKYINETIQNLPDAMPAIKTNVGMFVNVKFSLPIKIISNKLR